MILQVWASGFSNEQSVFVISFIHQHIRPPSLHSDSTCVFRERERSSEFSKECWFREKWCHYFTIHHRIWLPTGWVCYQYCFCYICWWHKCPLRKTTGFINLSIQWPTSKPELYSTCTAWDSYTSIRQYLDCVISRSDERLISNVSVDELVSDHNLIQFTASFYKPQKPTRESRGQVVTCWPGSQEVGGLIPGCATKFVRCKNLAFNIGECLLWLGYHVKLLVPCISGESSPEHVKDPRAPVDKSRVLIPSVTGQIPELLRIGVKLHRHHYRWMCIGVW